MAGTDTEGQTVRLAVLDDYLSLSATHLNSNTLPPNVSVTIFTDTLHSESELISRLAPFHILSTMRERTRFPASLLSQLPNLKLAIVTGARNLSFDTAAAKKHGIVATRAFGKRDLPAAPASIASLPGSAEAAAAGSGPEKTRVAAATAAYGTVQHTWALLLALARNVAADDADVRGSAGGWQTGLATDLAGRTIGIVGLGRLGAAVARIAYLAFGMRVLVWSENMSQERADGVARNVGLVSASESDVHPFVAVDKETLFRESDVVSLHLVLSERSTGVVGERELALMKPSSLLINTSRGPLISEDALLSSLEHGKIRGAALDVFDVEPLPADSPWRTTKWGQEGRAKVVLSPHMGYGEEELMNAWYAETSEIVSRWVTSGEVKDVYE